MNFYRKLYNLKMLLVRDTNKCSKKDRSEYLNKHQKESMNEYKDKPV